MSSSRLPVPPEPFVGHMPSATVPFVNRERELLFLSEWAGDLACGSILTVVGLGGTGKTALAQEWFTNHSERTGYFHGRMWWSLYEQDSREFFLACFSYLSGTQIGENQDKRPEELAVGIAQRLRDGRCLVVLDGLEREMIAYSSGIQADVSATATSHGIRRAASAAFGEFIRLCSRATSGSKLLLTSRLAPADLEDSNGRSMHGTQILELGGLDEASTRQYLSQLAIVDQSNELIEMAATAQFHPLLVSLIARQVAADPAALDRMKAALRSSGSTELRSVAMPILGSAINGLGPGARVVAQQIAAFKAPVSYSTLVKLLVGKDKKFDRESELDQALSRLQDLSLMTWNQEDNTYALHPVVRGAIWETMFASWVRP